MRVRGALAAVGLSVSLVACSQGGNESTVTVTGTTPATPQGTDVPQPPSSSDSPTEAPTSDPTSDPGPDADPEVVSEIVTGLTAPWGLDFFPNGDAIVTERDSKRVLRISGPDHEVSEIGVLDQAAPQGGEGGLLGVALSPDFADDATAYFYLTTATDNRIVRTTITDGGLGDLEVLLDGIPDGFIHDGGRLEFGPDGYLYASTGESGEPSLAPDLDSLGGKILRLTPDGDPAPGNPLDDEIYTYGHRNVQGLAFDDTDQLWASEFGQDTFDELNKITAGDDYGWPEVEGTGGEPEYTDPQQVWATDDASPSGLTYDAPYLWMAALNGERLWRVEVRDGEAVDPTPFFVGGYGRMRTVELAPDGTLWVMTSNRDGRGNPVDGDDVILQVRP